MIEQCISEENSLCLGKEEEIKLLKIIFWSFEIVTKIIIFDYTEKGKYGNENLQLREGKVRVQQPQILISNVQPETANLGYYFGLRPYEPKKYFQREIKRTTSKK